MKGNHIKYKQSKGWEHTQSKVTRGVAGLLVLMDGCLSSHAHIDMSDAESQQVFWLGRYCVLGCCVLTDLCLICRFLQGLELRLWLMLLFPALHCPVQDSGCTQMHDQTAFQLFAEIRFVKKSLLIMTHQSVSSLSPPDFFVKSTD